MTIIWAHMGLGRTVPPNGSHATRIEEILSDPDLHHVYFDISWDEVAKYVVASSEATKIMADLMQRHPDRFLFGTDAVAPTDQYKYLRVFSQYEPLWRSLDSETSRKVRLLNYERIFDEARGKVRRWESTPRGPAAVRSLVASVMRMTANRKANRKGEFPVLLRVVGCLPLRAEHAEAGEV